MSNVATKTVETSAPNANNADALNGRLACRTHAIHAVLIEAYRKQETLNVKTITARVNAVWARAVEGGAPTKDSATASHLNTMRKRRYVEHGADGRGWRLTSEGATLTGATLTGAADAPAPAKKRKSK